MDPKAGLDDVNKYSPTTKAKTYVGGWIILNSKPRCTGFMPHDREGGSCECRKSTFDSITASLNLGYFP
jgi:hypothetical protein